MTQSNSPLPPHTPCLPSGFSIFKPWVHYLCLTSRYTPHIYCLFLTTFCTPHCTPPCCTPLFLPHTFDPSTSHFTFLHAPRYCFTLVHCTFSHSPLSLQNVTHTPLLGSAAHATAPPLSALPHSHPAAGTSLTRTHTHCLHCTAGSRIGSCTTLSFWPLYHNQNMKRRATLRSA